MSIVFSVDLPVGQDHLLHQFATPATVNIGFCNRTASPISVRAMVGTGASPALKDWVISDAGGPNLPATGACVLERTGLSVQAGERVWVRAAAPGVSVRLYGED